MSSLNELINYCNETNPLGALMLTGEWGCGKTYLIDKELKKALKDTHIIVRVSLFGMGNEGKLRDAVRKKWFEACLPLLDTLQKVQKGGLFSTFSKVLYRFNPIAGGAARVVVSANMEDFIPIKSTFEDLKTHEKKKVVLVYDDLERSQMDFAEVLGVINDYCENHRFHSIILANEEPMRVALNENIKTYHMLREKTISQVLFHIPEYGEVIHKIISESNWHTPEYKEYLLAHEEDIRRVFISEEEEEDISSLIQKNRRNHNFRTLMKGMDSFFRVFHEMKESGIEVEPSHLCAFLAYYIVANSGIMRDGETCMSFEDKDIAEFYPQYSTELMTNSERSWITTGIWDKEGFLKEMSVS